MGIERSIVKACPLFARLDDAELERLVELIKVRGCHAGTPIFEAGEVSNALYIISSGAVRIQLPQNKEKRIVLKAGDFFGEMGVIRNTRRSADALIEQDATLLEIRREDFDRLMALDKTIAEKIIAAFMDRCAEMTAPDPTPAAGAAGFVPAERRCRVVTVFSPSGGSGSTTLACSLAIKAREYTSKRVGLIDGDLEFGAAHLALGTKPTTDAAGLMAEVEISGLTLEKYVQKLHYGVDFLPCPQRSLQAESRSASVWRSAVNNLADRCDFLFIDTSSGVSEVNVAFFELSDDIVMVLAPEVISVNRVLTALDALKRRSVPTDKVKLVCNRYRKEGLLSPEDLEKRFGRRLFGRIEFDASATADALNEGFPVVLRSPTAPVAVDLCRTVRQILCLPAAAEEGRTGRSSGIWNLFS